MSRRGESISGVSARVGAIAESATLAIDARAKRLASEGVHVIGFGAGEPDFPTPAHVVEAARAACAEARWHHYSPAGGLPELREAVAKKTRQDSGLDVEWAQVLVTNGVKQACYEAFATLLDPGDEVLVPSPYWVSYPEAIRMAGGVPVAVPAGEQTAFRVSVDALEAARTERTKLLVFASPHNPTGAVYPPAETEAIGRWALEHGIWVLTDEIYEFLVYGEARFSSLPGLVPELAERCVVVSGVSKTFAMTGWRVGWLVGPPAVVEAATNLHSHLTGNVSNVAQAAALAALSGGTDDIEEMRQAFDRRRRTMHRMLNAIPGVECVEPQGAFYAFPSMRGLLGRRLGDRTAASTAELGELLLEVVQVAIVPGEAFGAPGYARLSYALGDAELEEGLTRVAALVDAAT